MRISRTSGGAIFLVAVLAICATLVFGSWSKEADRVCMNEVTVILTVDGDYMAAGQILDFGPQKKWTTEFMSLGGPGALVNRTVDLAGIMDNDGNLEVYRVRFGTDENEVDICTRMAGRPTGPGGAGGTPCPGPYFDFDRDCN